MKLMFENEKIYFFSAGHMLDLLRIQSRNGAMALLESLMIHYPTLYTQITGRQPSIEPSHFSGQSVSCYPIWILKRCIPVVKELHYCKVLK